MKRCISTTGFDQCKLGHNSTHGFALCRKHHLANLRELTTLNGIGYYSTDSQKSQLLTWLLIAKRINMGKDMTRMVVSNIASKCDCKLQCKLTKESTIHTKRCRTVTTEGRCKNRCKGSNFWFNWDNFCSRHGGAPLKVSRVLHLDQIA